MSIPSIDTYMRLMTLRLFLKEMVKVLNVKGEKINSSTFFCGNVLNLQGL